MTGTRHVQRPDGSIAALRRRTWTLADATIRIARDRSTAVVTIKLATDGDELHHTATWYRQPPNPWNTSQRYARTWTHHDEDNARWAIEYGYDGRWWCLFGRDGTPWGKLLDNTLRGSLAEATEHIARLHAAVRDDHLGDPVATPWTVDLDARLAARKVAAQTQPGVPLDDRVLIAFRLALSNSTWPRNGGAFTSREAAAMFRLLHTYLASGVHDDGAVDLQSALDKIECADQDHRAYPPRTGPVPQRYRTW